MLALYLLSQFAAYMTPLEWIDKLYYSVHPIIYWISGLLMLVMTVIDKWIFAFHPL